MNLLREYIRELLTESAIHPKIMSMIDRAEKHGLKVRVGKYSVGISDGDFSIATVSWEDGMHGPCLNSSNVTSTYVKGGFGPLAYDVAIEASGGLAPDRLEVSDEALRVWSYYEKIRDDVKKDQLDDLYNELTPEHEDNCEQESSSHHMGDDWHLSPLSKKYSKHGTPVIDELRRRGMLQE